MTTIASARSELVDALDDAGVRAVSAPLSEAGYVLVLRDGVEATRVMAGQVDVSFTLRIIGGAIDSEKAADELDAMMQTVYETVRALPGWRVGDAGADTGRDYNGSTYLTADVGASRRVDI